MFHAPKKVGDGVGEEGGGGNSMHMMIKFFICKLKKISCREKKWEARPTPPLPMLYVPDKSIIQIYYTYVLSTTKTAEHLLHIYNLKQN